jgi:hypothetical protein
VNEVVKVIPFSSYCLPFFFLYLSISCMGSYMLDMIIGMELSWCFSFFLLSLSLLLYLKDRSASLAWDWLSFVFYPIFCFIFSVSIYVFVFVFVRWYGVCFKDRTVARWILVLDLVHGMICLS